MVAAGEVLRTGNCKRPIKQRIYQVVIVYLWGLGIIYNSTNVKLEQVQWLDIPERVNYKLGVRHPAVSTSTFRQSLKTRLFSAYQHVVSRNALYKCTILTYLLTYMIFAARCYASAAYMPSCGVCVSVCHVRDSVETNKYIFKFFHHRVATPF